MLLLQQVALLSAPFPLLTQLLERSPHALCENEQIHADGAMISSSRRRIYRQVHLSIR